MQTFECELPSGNKVTYRAPFNRDRHSVLRSYMDERGKGPSETELLASLCLVTINGSQKMDPHPANRMVDWTIKDVQFYQGVFLERFYLNGDSDVESIKAAAKDPTSSTSADVG